MSENKQGNELQFNPNIICETSEGFNSNSSKSKFSVFPQPEVLSSSNEILSINTRENFSNCYEEDLTQEKTDDLFIGPSYDSSMTGDVIENFTQEKTDDFFIIRLIGPLTQAFPVLRL